MQPLKTLNNEQKARLLHSLFYGEMPHFIAYLSETTNATLANAETVRAEWKDHFFSADLWLSLAAEVQKRLTRYGKELHRSSPVFAEQLFEGYTALYMVQHLINYGGKASTDPKFTQAVELLFV